jgi:hypothetical protein
LIPTGSDPFSLAGKYVAAGLEINAFQYVAVEHVARRNARGSADRGAWQSPVLLNSRDFHSGRHG